MSESIRTVISVPRWTRERGMPVEFDDGAEVAARVHGGIAVIEGNAAGLRSLARLLLTLAAEDVPEGTHVHLEGSMGLRAGSSEVVIERGEFE